MAMNSSCFHTLREYEELLASVDLIRSQMSYFGNFSALLATAISSEHEHDADTQHESYSSDASTLITVYMVRLPLYVLLMLVSLVGNGLVIVVICTNRFMLNKPTNYFMLNLAVCDLAILASCIWVEMVASVHRHWLLSELFCKLSSYMQVAVIIASVLTLVAITCDRFMAVMRPLRWHTTRTRTLCCIALTWLVSLTMALPSYMYRSLIEIRWSDYSERYCDDLHWPVVMVADEHGCSKIAQPARRLYYTTVILVMFFVPMLVMSVAYSIVIARLWRAPAIGESLGSSHNVQQQQSKKKKLIVMLVWILVVFFVCWSPLEAMLLYSEYSAEFPGWWSHVDWIAYMMAYASTAINPFIYFVMSESYNRGFRRVQHRLMSQLSSRIRRRERSPSSLTDYQRQHIASSRCRVVFLAHSFKAKHQHQQTTQTN